MPAFRSVIRRLDSILDTCEPCEFEALRVGDVFRAFEPDGNPVGDWQRVTEAPTACLPEGNYYLQAEPV